MIGLVDNLIQLLKEREKNREKLFINFVEPMYCSFNLAHENYLDSLVRYQKFCEGEIDFELDELLALAHIVMDDSRETYHIRRSCLEQSQLLSEMTRYDFSPLIEAVDDYFNGDETESQFINKQRHPIALCINHRRSKLSSYLDYLQLGISDESYRKILAHGQIQELIDEVQGSRDNVEKEYLKAKYALLVK
ncbi:hypothetical protein [Photobacterium leiognathi]|uniref:hypothetical protein n=1 Tax=Photobacterium leiognathi TaxID=553611 RepID=UPI002981803C|nr:hypothetical protein [Photobacterium leiognathi]